MQGEGRVEEIPYRTNGKKENSVKDAWYVEPRCILHEAYEPPLISGISRNAYMRSVYMGNVPGLTAIQQ
jgi:hypothetical protein